MANSDLEFVTTTQLIKELQDRMDHMVLMASSNRSGNEDSFLFSATGPAHSCIGLVEVGRLMLLAGNDRSEDDVTD